MKIQIREVAREGFRINFFNTFNVKTFKTLKNENSIYVLCRGTVCSVMQLQ